MPKLEEMEFHKTSSVIPFIREFGKDPKVDNVIVEYSKLFAKMSNEFKSGFGKFILWHLNKAMLSGEGAIHVDAAVNPTAYILNYRTLGLESLPKYFKALQVPVHAFSTAQDEIATLNANADSKAAAIFLRSKHNQAYTSFLDRELAKLDAIEKGHWQTIHDAATRAEIHAFSQSVELDDKATAKHAQVQAPAGVEASQEAYDKIDYERPTFEETEAKAQQEANQFLETMAHEEETTAAVITNEEQEAMGVSLSFTTAQKTAGESSMQPTVIIKGTKGDLSGKISGLPQPDETLTQVFPSDHALGDIVSVTVEAEPGSLDPWMVKSISAKVGDNEVQMQQKLVWIDPNPQGTPGLNHEGFEYSNKFVFTPAET